MIELDMVSLQELILCNKERRGKGTEISPTRCVFQVYTKGGELIAEKDPEVKFTISDIVEFCGYYNKYGEGKTYFNAVTDWLYKRKNAVTVNI